jgi:iron complex outermembrane receptor protein
MKTSIWLVSSALCSVLAASPAIAQEASKPAVAPSETVDEVVVTAERFGSGLTRATFTLGAEDIQQRPLGAEITQALVKVPGVQVSTGDTRGGSFSFEIYMRGLSDEQIGLTLDGIPTGDSRFNGGSPPARFIESSNVGKITVSQSAGDIGAPSRFALGGFIDFVTDAPRKDFGMTVEGGAGSFDFTRLYARVDTGEIAPGLSSYFTYSTSKNDIWAGRDSRHSKREHYEFKAVKDFDDGSFNEGPGLVQRPDRQRLQHRHQGRVRGRAAQRPGSGRHHRHPGQGHRFRRCPGRHAQGLAGLCQRPLQAERQGHAERQSLLPDAEG